VRITDIYVTFPFGLAVEEGEREIVKKGEREGKGEGKGREEKWKGTIPLHFALPRGRGIFCVHAHLGTQRAGLRGKED